VLQWERWPLYPARRRVLREVPLRLHP